MALTCYFRIRIRRESPQRKKKVKIPPVLPTSSDSPEKPFYYYSYSYLSLTLTTDRRQFGSGRKGNPQKNDFSPLFLLFLLLLGLELELGGTAGVGLLGAYWAYSHPSQILHPPGYRTDIHIHTYIHSISMHHR